MSRHADVTAPRGHRRLTTSARRRRGLSLVEVLVSLAISATLMTAVGAAYTASCQAVAINESFFRASQSARICLNQLLSEIRQCAIVEVQGDRLNVLTNAPKAKTYRYDPVARKLLLSVTDAAGVTTEHALGRDIASMTFAGDGKGVSVAITVTCGNNSVTLNGSAFPRQNVAYR
jgi:prepilin-type N-terminal cleavage/methylation domain-containing protein